MRTNLKLKMIVATASIFSPPPWISKRCKLNEISEKIYVIVLQKILQKIFIAKSSAHITIINFNKSKYPKIFKSTIIPVYKLGNRQIMSNYRLTAFTV